MTPQFAGHTLHSEEVAAWGSGVAQLRAAWVPPRGRMALRGVQFRFGKAHSTREAGIALAARTSSLPVQYRFKGSIVISLCAIASILFFSGLTYYQDLKSEHTDMAEQEAVDLAEFCSMHFRDVLFNKDEHGNWHFQELGEEEFGSLDALVAEHLRHFPIVKIKVFDTEARLIYSTDKRVIGKQDVENAELLVALQGGTVSEWAHEGGPWDMAEEERFDLEVVETYIPIHDDTERVVGAYELYLDVTEHHDRFVTSLKAFLVRLGCMLLAMFSIVCAIVFFCGEKDP